MSVALVNSHEIENTVTKREEVSRHSTAKNIVGPLIPIVLLIVSCFTSIVLIKTDILNEIILKNLAISNHSEMYDMWLRTPVKPLLKIYIFNYTNLDAVKRGYEKKFKVEEIGPYTYSEITEKVNVVFNDDGTVTYQENRTYIFRRELSSGTEEDIVVSPKLVMISAASMLPNMNLFLHIATSLMLHTTPTFLAQSVHDFLWVGDNELLTIGAKMMEGKPFDNFGIFSSRSGLSRHRITVHTGQNDSTKLGVVSRIDDRPSLGAWDGAECDRIDGSTGAMFPPTAVSPAQTLYIFNPDMCRRFPLAFKRHVQTRRGIPALRFEAPHDVFETPDRNPENECFCRSQPAACSPSGVFDISPCTMGAPIMLSFPHFYMGDPALRDVVDGLHPNPQKHYTFIDVHESLGVPLAGISRFQINVAIQKGSNVLVIEEFEDGMIIPIVWFELGVMELPENLEILVYHITFSIQRMQLLLCIAAFMVAAASATCIVRRLLASFNIKCRTEDTGRMTLLSSSGSKIPA